MVDLDPSEDIRRKQELAVEFAKILLATRGLTAQEIAKTAWELVWALERESKALGGV